MAMFYKNLVRSFSFKRNVYVQNVLFRKILPSAQMHCTKVLMKSQELKMPSLSPTMTEGTIVKWLKKEGDSFSPGDVLCEIQTDKAIVGFEVEDEGILAKILAPDDSKDVSIGTVIAIMVDLDDDWRTAAVPSKQTSGDILASSVTSQPSASTGVLGVQIKMPSLSPTMTEGTIVKWLKQEGESFVPGDVLCEIQTDKAVVAFEMEEEGILAKILVPEDTKDIKLGTVIALMVNEGEDWRNVSIPPSQSVLEAVPVKDTSSSASTGHEAMPKLCGPSVRNLLSGYNLKYSLLTPTGPHNVLLKSDVLKYISTKSLKPKVAETEEAKPHDVQSPAIEQKYVDVPITSMRRIIAKRLLESKVMIPHAYMGIDCISKEVSSLRNQMKNEGIKVSINDFIIKCAAISLVQVPSLNVVCQNGVGKTLDSVDISVAVATENGLITPIIKQANLLTVPEISERVRQLATKARAGRLKPDEFQGGSFSISNLGMFGISAFTAVINPPQGAILAIGTSRITVDQHLKPCTKITVSLSFDRRIIEEVEAAQFLKNFKTHFENPIAMMVSSPGCVPPNIEQ